MTSAVPFAKLTGPKATRGSIKSSSELVSSTADQSNVQRGARAKSSAEKARLPAHPARDAASATEPKRNSATLLAPDETESTWVPLAQRPAPLANRATIWKSGTGATWSRAIKASCSAASDAKELSRPPLAQVPFDEVKFNTVPPRLTAGHESCPTCAHVSTTDDRLACSTNACKHCAGWIESKV